MSDSQEKQEIRVRICLGNRMERDTSGSIPKSNFKEGKNLVNMKKGKRFFFIFIGYNLILRLKTTHCKNIFLLCYVSQL